jgi:hypothetical protein
VQKNVGSQKLIVFAFDATTNLPKTGDAGNLTAYVSKDFGAVTVLGDTTATEMESTNAKGYYLFDLTAGETNGDTLMFSGKSATANIVVVAVPAVVFTTPPNFSLESIDGSGRVTVITYVGDTPQTGDAFSRIGATGSGLTSLAPASTALSTVQWTNGRAANLDNLDAAVSTRAPSATALSTAQWTNGRAGNLDNLDAAISTRSTYAGGAVASVTGNVGGSVASVTNPVTLTSGERDAVADAHLDRANGIETGVTPRQVHRGIAAALAGQNTGAGSGTEVFKAANNAGTTRTTYTIDAAGNRTSVTLNW